MDAPVTYRRFDDIDGQRQDIFDLAKQSIGSMKPFSTPSHSVEIADVDYDDDYNPSIAEEKDAILKRKSLQRALKGTVRLKDAQGNVVEEQRMTLAHVPYLNSRGLFIRNGVPYAVRNQLRLRPGVYTRKQRSGGYESQFNVRPGTGRGFRVEMDPESGLFKMRVDQSTTKLYPVLRAMGVSDDDMRQAWGDDLFEKNAATSKGRDELDLSKLVRKLSGKDEDVDPETAAEALRNILQKSEVDEDTTELTLGERVARIEPRHILAATRKQLAVARGEAESDNRDSQAYQSFHAAQDLLAERMRRDATGAARNSFWKAARLQSLKNLQPGFMNPNIGSLFEGSGLALTVEDINPIDVYDTRQAVTRLGEGGMSRDAVSRDARNVQSSYIGVIDASRAPESDAIGVDLRVTDAAMRGSDGQLYTTVRNLKTGQLETLSARTLSTKSVTFPGEMGNEGKRVPAIRGDRITYVPKSEVDYEVVSPDDMASRASRLIPFPEGIKGQRLLMGARMTSQAVPLQEPEAPFVQTGNADGSSLHAAMGRDVGARMSPADGIVTKVTPDVIEMTGNDGQKHQIQLYNNYPTARKTVLHNDPVVQPGTVVKAGQMLARSNFTDGKGTFAIGRNLRVGYMVAEGDSIEDAFVISESAAKKLGAQAMYKADLDLGQIASTDKSSYNAVYAGKYNPQQLDQIDDDGVIKVGATVQKGDPLILAIGNKPQSLVGAVTKSAKSQVSDQSQVWEHAAPGIVTDISRTKDGIRVLVRSYDVTQVGDKLSGRYGNKGVVSAQIRPDDQMPIAADGKPLEAIINANGIISRVNPAALAESLLGKIVERTGRDPYVVKPFSTPEGIADFALNEAAKHGISETETVVDPRDGRKIPNVFVGNSYIMRLHHKAEGKISGRDQGTYTVDEYPARGGAEGCFIAEQPVLTRFGSMPIGDIVHLKAEVHVLTWSDVAGSWVYRPVTDWFEYTARASDLRVVELEPSAGITHNVFTATLNHNVVMYDGGMKTVAELHPGDRLTAMGQDGARVPVRIADITPYQADEEFIAVYDITVDDTHLYCAGAALVSNSKRISLLDTGTLLAAGATNFLKDAKLVRGQRNDDYWRQVRHGETPMLPTGAFADEQFKSLLKAAGVNVREAGTKEQLSPLLDTDVDRMASHEIQNAETFDFETMRPVEGGLFDTGITGGAGGNKFAKITLPVKVPHPLFLDPIRRILGLTGKELDAVLMGKEQLNGETGPGAVEKALGEIDVPREMELAKQTIRTGSATKRDAAVKRLHYLAGLQKMHVSPQDLMVSKIAVVPPRYRPIVRGRNTDMIHDLNYLYKDLLEARKNYQDAKGVFGEAHDEYGTLMKAVQAVTGIEGPVNPKTAEQGVKGVLQYAIGLGTSPKAGGYQRKVIGTAVDTVGRSVITADRSLGLDDVGIPETMAWKMFRPYVIRRLVTQGMPPAEALQAVEDRTPAAAAMLDEEMKVRPVVYNRAPALHRYAYQGAWARRVPDDSIHVPYYTLKAIGGDFDGDAINIHVPSSYEAIEDVKEKLMPSKNLFFTGNFETHYEPTQDYTLGLHLAGKMDPSQKPVTFANAQEAKAAYARGLINARTPIRILS